MAFAHGRTSITYNDILDRTSEYYILMSYLKPPKIPCVIKSPFRKDNKPSFSIYYRNNRIHFFDFATKEHGNLPSLLMKLWSCSYNDVIESLSKGLIDMPKYQKTKLDKHINTSNDKSELQCKVREWGEYDINYWESFGISKEWCIFGNVYPISHKIIIKNNKKYVFGVDKYAYCYVENKDNNITLKIYQPYNKNGYKWCGNINKSVWSLWTKLPSTGDRLFITSSLKDSLNLWANIGIPAICMQGEGYYPKESVMNELKSRFKQIIVFFDNDYSNPDNPGRKDSIDLCNMYGLQRIEIPKEWEAKDPSDLYKKWGKETYTKVISNLLNNLKND